MEHQVVNEIMDNSIWSYKLGDRTLGEYTPVELEDLEPVTVDDCYNLDLAWYAYGLLDY